MCRLQLNAMGESQRTEWLVAARLDAILGGMKHTMASWCSGLRCWFAFIGALGWHMVCCTCRLCHFACVVARRRFSWPWGFLPTEFGGTASMVDTFQIRWHAEQLPELCADGLYHL